MNSLDIIILVILAFFSIMSFFRGFIRGAFALIGLILGIIGANFFYPYLGAILSKSINNTNVSYLLAYVLILVVITVIVILIGKYLNKSIELSLLKWLDRFLGLGFGFVKGLIVAYILVFVLGVILPSDSSVLRKSQTRPLILKLYSFVPDDFFRSISNQKSKLNNNIKKQAEASVKQKLLPEQ